LPALREAGVLSKPIVGILVRGRNAGSDTGKLVQFVEAPGFSRHRDEYLDDDGIRELQQYLATNPEAGDLIAGAGGIRKLRWKDSRRGKGKRGGLRVIYYWFLSDEEIWLLTLFDKDEAADLTKGEKDQLRHAMEAERAARNRRSEE
jgi:hypothetical protein